MALTNILLDTLTSVEGALKLYVSNTSANFIGSITPIIVAGIGIHYTLIAYAVMRGQEQDPIQKVLKEAFTTIFIIAIALSVGSYQSIVVDGVKSVTDFITANISSNSTATPLYKKISLLWGGNVINYKGQNVPALNALWDMANEHPTFLGIPNFDYLIGGIIMTIANIIICILCIIPYFISTLYIYILLAIGPLFIMGAIWPATRNYFSAWLANLVGNILTICIVTAVCSLSTTMYTNALIVGMTDVANLSIFQPMLVTGSLLIIAIFLGMIAIQAGQQGAQLAGGGLAMDSKGVAGMAIQTFMQSRMFAKQAGGAPGGEQASPSANSISKSGGMLSAAGKVATTGLMAAAGGPMTAAAAKGIARIARGLSKRN